MLEVVMGIKDKFNCFWEKHATGIGIITTVGTIVGGTLLNYFLSRNCEYGENWLRNASDEELANEREKYIVPAFKDYDPYARAIVSSIDNETNKRWGESHSGDKHNCKLPPREHGWNLMKDEKDY